MVFNASSIFIMLEIRILLSQLTIDLAVNTCLKISGFLNCNQHPRKLDPRIETLLTIAYEMEIKFEYLTERINYIKAILSVFFDEMW